MNNPGELTPREIEVVLELKKGKSNKDIAQSLNISIPTVENHLVHIFRKMDVSSRLEAAINFAPNGPKNSGNPS